MNIAMIGQKGIPAKFGGVERHVHDLSVRLVEKGHDVTVYSRHWYTKGKTPEVGGVIAKILPSIETKHLDTISHTFLSTVDAIEQGADVIHYHGVGPALLSWIPRVFAPETTVVTTFHAVDRKQLKWGPFARLMLRLGERATTAFAHNTIAVSKTIQSYIKKEYNVDAEYIPNGVPTYKKIQNLSVLQDFGLKPGEYIIDVSRLIPDKGIHHLITAFKTLKATYASAIGNKKLVIVGDGYDTDEYVNSLKKMAQDEPDIIFTGFQTGDDLHQLFSHAAFMVHPSSQEGLPIAVLEGMAFGLPILVSDIPQHKELISDKKFLFTDGDAKNLKKKLVGVLGMSAKAIQATQERNKSFVQHTYDWKRIVTKTLLVYREAKQVEVVKDLGRVKG